MIDCVLAVDIGTTSLKAGLISANGEVVSFFRKEFEKTLYAAAKGWLPAFEEAFEFFNSKKDGTHIVGVAVSGNGPTVVSEDGTTLLWNDDIPSEVQSAIPKNIPSLFIPRILAFRQMFQSASYLSPYLFSGPEYLIYKLTGRPLTILPESRFENAYWTSQMLAQFKIDPSVLPPFLPPSSFCGEWKGIPVFAGGPDFIVALIGTNTLRPGKLCDRSGSSEGFNLCVKNPITAPGLRTLPSVISGLWNVSALVPDSGSLSEQKRLEKIKEALNLLRDAAAKNNVEFPSQMAVTGGQAKDSVWMKLKGDELGMKLTVNECPDAELLGDACCGFVGLGVYKSIGEAAQAMTGGTSYDRRGGI